jgi:hypothetical protein
LYRFWKKKILKKTTRDPHSCLPSASPSFCTGSENTREKEKKILKKEKGKKSIQRKTKGDKAYALPLEPYESVRRALIEPY